MEQLNIKSKSLEKKIINKNKELGKIDVPNEIINKDVTKDIQFYDKVFKFYKMKNNVQICCHGRPKKKDLIFLKTHYNLNYVLTILYEKENPEIINKYCKEIDQNIKWNNLKLQGANMALFMQKKTQNEIIKFMEELFSFFEANNNTTIFLHCAAGIHRTGTILYTILRISGETPESAKTAIKYIREQTYLGCGENRFKYAEEFLVKPYLNKHKNNNI